MLVDGSFSCNISDTRGDGLDWIDWFTWQEEGADWRRPTVARRSTVKEGGDGGGGSPSEPLDVAARREASMIIAQREAVVRAQDAAVRHAEEQARPVRREKRLSSIVGSMNWNGASPEPRPPRVRSCGR